MFEPHNYPYCSFEFDSWNPVQKKCYPYFEQQCNLVVSSSTASGKSAIAEAIFGYELANSETSKVVYVSPLKALGKEKYDGCTKHETFSKYQRLLVSSDEKVYDHDFEDSRIIVSTIESMNIRCRNKCRWVKDISVIVLDEAHLINDKSRGSGAETMMINLSMLNPNCRMICLSGTLSNSKEIAVWLKRLNGLPSYFVNSTWRPSELIKQVEIANDIKEQKEKVKLLIVENEKTLIFVHSKRIGEDLHQYLKKCGIKNAFYNADMKPKIKEMILEDFKCEYSDLDVLIATNSLGMGLDL